MAKIAVDLETALARRAENGTPGAAEPRLLAEGPGWSVTDVVCTSGPDDRPFEERHDRVSLAIVAAGTFQYRSPGGRVLMTPGSLLLGNAGHCFECGHEHAAGDRCIAFRYDPELFARLSADAAGDARSRDFSAVRLPPLRPLAPIVAAACAALGGCAQPPPWDELAIRLAALAARLERGLPAEDNRLPPNALARVTGLVRSIEERPADDWSLASMALELGVSAYHFLRSFQKATGLTPHQFVIRCRLRAAAVRLASKPTRVIDAALDCGFGDVSNFNRAFRSKFGLSPRAFRRQVLGQP